MNSNDSSPKIHPIDVEESKHRHRIVITMDGGLIQGINTEHPTDIIVVDYDLKGITNEEYKENVKKIKYPDGNFDEAFINDWLNISPEPEFVDHIFKQFTVKKDNKRIMKE